MRKIEKGNREKVIIYKKVSKNKGVKIKVKT